MAFCANCGTALSDLAAACPKCGHPRQSVTVSRSLARTEGFAIASLIFGVVGFMVFPLIPSIGAVIFGAKAKENLRRDPTLQGEGMAKAGVILGWVGIGVSSLLIVVLIAIAMSGF